MIRLVLTDCCVTLRRHKHSLFTLYCTFTGVVPGDTTQYNTQQHRLVRSPGESGLEGLSGKAQKGLGLVQNESSDPLVDGASVKKLGRCGLSVVLRSFPVKLGRKDVCVKLLVVVVQLVSVNKDLCGGLGE